MDFYREAILDHYQQPRNWQVISPATFDHEETNPLCGDRLRLTLWVTDHRIADLGWSGEGCAISCATASMLGEMVLGKTLDEARAIQKQEVLDMLGITLSAIRLKCALLSLKVLKVGLYGLAGWNETESG